MLRRDSGVPSTLDAKCSWELFFHGPVSRKEQRGLEREHVYQYVATLYQHLRLPRDPVRLVVQERLDTRL